MQMDFHYYATYCAAILAGYSHEESMDICYSAQFVDLCSKTLLGKIGAPAQAATTQLQLELMDGRSDLLAVQESTSIWSSFHFLPGNLHKEKNRRTKLYMDKYRLVCMPNGELVKKTVQLAMGQSLQHVGIAMHVLADTWAHMFFAGTPSLVINNVTTGDFYEMKEDGTQSRIFFRHNPSVPDDPEKNLYTNSLYQSSETSVMNLGHGRAGHLPDYSYLKYRYLPAWSDYRMVLKDNPSDYMHAFCQMIYALKKLRAGDDDIRTEIYDTDAIAGYEERIDGILKKRQLIACDDWKAFGEELSGMAIPDFDIETYQEEYMQAAPDQKEETFLGRFIRAALAQKRMVCEEIQSTGNLLTGIPMRRRKKDKK
ncbi:MAG: hypothetical protein J5518_04575 [Lachnospiraceae bacterium]|nr:hypothetical protein [Lachnospiraceae bacterium]